jgi:hypothetical protein
VPSCAAVCLLQPGHHTFRFLLNAQQQEPGVFQPMAGMLAQASPAQYAVLQHLPLETLPSGVTANSLRVPAPPTFRLLYHTNFSEAYITYRFSGQQVRGAATHQSLLQNATATGVFVHWSAAAISAKQHNRMQVHARIDQASV